MSGYGDGRTERPGEDPQQKNKTFDAMKHAWRIATHPVIAADSYLRDSMYNFEHPGIGIDKHRRFNQKARIHDAKNLIESQADYEIKIANSKIDYLVREKEIKELKQRKKTFSLQPKLAYLQCQQETSKMHRAMLREGESACRRTINSYLEKEYIQDLGPSTVSSQFANYEPNLETSSSPDNPSPQATSPKETEFKNFSIEKFEMPTFSNLTSDHLEKLAKDVKNKNQVTLEDINEAAQGLKAYVKKLSKARSEEYLLRANDVSSVKLDENPLSKEYIAKVAKDINGVYGQSDHYSDLVKSTGNPRRELGTTHQETGELQSENLPWKGFAPPFAHTDRSKDTKLSGWVDSLKLPDWATRSPLRIVPALAVASVGKVAYHGGKGIIDLSDKMVKKRKEVDSAINVVANEDPKNESTVVSPESPLQSSKTEIKETDDVSTTSKLASDMEQSTDKPKTLSEDEYKNQLISKWKELWKPKDMQKATVQDKEAKRRLVEEIKALRENNPYNLNLAEVHKQEKEKWEQEKRTSQEILPIDKLPVTEREVTSAIAEQPSSPKKEIFHDVPEVEEINPSINDVTETVVKPVQSHYKASTRWRFGGFFSFFKKMRSWKFPTWWGWHKKRIKPAQKPTFRSYFWKLASEASLDCRDDRKLSFIKPLRKPLQIQTAECGQKLDKTTTADRGATPKVEPHKMHDSPPQQAKLSQTPDSALTPETTELTQEEQNKYDESNIDIHGDQKLTVNHLKEAGLLPKYKVEIKNTVDLRSSSDSKNQGADSPNTTILLSKIFNNGKRLAVIGYVKDEDKDKYVARTYYLSLSQGVWRYLPRYSDEWYDKGHSEDSITVPISLQFALIGIKKQQEQQEGRIPAPEDKELIKRCFGGTARKVDNTQSEPKGSYYQKVEAEPHKLNGNFITEKKVPPDTLNFNPTKEGNDERPDFSNQPITSTNQKTELYGPITIEVYPSKDKTLQYMFCRDEKGRAWIGGIEDVSRPITSLGVRQRWINAGDLTTPAYEYSEQAGIYGNEKDRPKGHTKYVDMYENYIKHIPVIKEYSDHIKSVELNKQLGSYLSGLIQDKISKNEQLANIL